MTANDYSGQALIVDDDVITAELLQAELEESGFRVTIAHDLASLRQKVTQRTFAFVLLDLFLGDESGLEAIPFLIQESPYTKIIVMSAHGTVQLAVDAMERGAASFICKSKDPKELIVSLKTKLAPIPSAPAGTSSDPSERYGIVGVSPSIQEVITKIEQIKDIDSTVLITGESGTGKELVARAIHGASMRSEARFEAVNCGAIPENLLESELFGHKRGAFTDAKADRKGLFELCENGTLFLDEIGELPLILQVKLLRVLQEKEVMPLGSGRSVKVNARIIASTNKSLATAVKEGTFRSDLFYRLNVLEISLPALRERTSDIPLLARFLLKRFNVRFSKTVSAPSKELESRLIAYRWPGNIRELQNAFERGVVLSKDGLLHLEDMLGPGPRETSNPPESSLEQSKEEEIWSASLSEAKKNFEKIYLRRLLEVTHGNVSEIARISGRYRADIYRLMTKYGVEWTEFRNHSS